MTFAADCLRRAQTGEPDAVVALVRLWAHLADHGAMQAGLSRERVEADVLLARAALDHGTAPVAVHPAAALRALDGWLADGRVGHEPWVVELDDEGVSVVGRPPGWSSTLSRAQPNHREYWLRAHQVVPMEHRGIRIRVVAAPADLEDRLGVAALGVWAGGFAAGAGMDWGARPPSLRDPPARAREAVDVLARALAGGAHVVVLPELTVDRTVIDHVADWLKEERRALAVVATGSAYEGGWNVARLCDARGEPLLEHRKLEPMRARMGDEDIRAGDALTLLACRRGLLALAVCLDFCEGGDTPVSRLWHAVGPALVLVPSMGDAPTLSAHQRRADDVWLQHATAVVVASQHPIEPEAVGMVSAGPAGRTVGSPEVAATLPWWTPD